MLDMSNVDIKLVMAGLQKQGGLRANRNGAGFVYRKHALNKVLSEMWLEHKTDPAFDKEYPALHKQVVDILAELVNYHVDSLDIEHVFRYDPKI